MQLGSFALKRTHTWRHRKACSLLCLVKPRHSAHGTGIARVAMRIRSPMVYVKSCWAELIGMVWLVLTGLL